MKGAHVALQSQLCHWTSCRMQNVCLNPKELLCIDETFVLVHLGQGSRVPFLLKMTAK